MKAWKRLKPAPLLSDAEMKRLHEEIFEEPVSLEILYEMLNRASSKPGPLEWVMDKPMRDRVRRLAPPLSWSFLDPSWVIRNYEERLLGLPIVVEPFAKLAIRERSAVES